jgi:anti-anti-sigma factor
MSPELATVGREGCLAAARISDGETLRLSGELDFSSAEALGDVLRAHFHGKLQLDLADLDFVDVAGMRALRGTKEQPLIIVAASDCVHRLVSLLAWDTAPGIEIAAPA